MAALTYSQADLQRFSRSNNSIEIADIEAFLESATEQYLVPFLSQEFTDTILLGTETDVKVIKYFKESVINFALFLYSQDAAVSFGSQGAYEFSDTEHGQNKVTQANLVRYEQHKLKTGHQKLELLLKYLEKTTALTVWHTNAGAAYKEFLLKSVDDFQKHVNIRDSRIVFLSCRPGMRLATYTNVIPTISEGLYNSVFAAPATAKYKVLIDRFLAPALANFAMAYSIYDIAAMIGLFDTVSIFDNTNTTDLSKKYKTAPETLIDKIKSSKIEIGQTYLNQCVVYILSKPGDYTEYPHPQPTDSSVFENDEDWRLFYTGTV